MLVGIVSGIISGFIVSGVLWVWNVLRRDPLELRFVAPNRAFLRNNRLRTMVVGGSWEIEKGATIYRGDDFRGEDHGLVIQPFETLPVRTHMLQPGQPTMVALKRLPIRLGRLPDSKLREWERAEIDPAVYIGREKDLPEDWKLQTIFLRA
ncbi:hypothetical protein [uncultured Corynebacterium sp.]|uniref:hypothetical protein n=1 Tax=uncultured Corynebacterium sp. TaxID=159447 RepID=UPI00259B4EEC|nr:hypothetical protein [uncultured Corynebacterium sp.]